MTSEQETAMYDQPSGVSREELVEKATKALYEAKHRGNYWGDITHEVHREHWRGITRAVLTVFEEAHAPTECRDCGRTDGGCDRIMDAPTKCPECRRRGGMHKLDCGQRHPSYHHYMMVEDAPANVSEPGKTDTPTDDEREAVRVALEQNLMDSVGACTCDEAYTGRDLIDPNCGWHDAEGTADDESVDRVIRAFHRTAQGEPNPDREAQGMSEAEDYARDTEPSKRAETVDDFMTGWRTADRTRVQGETSDAQVQAALHAYWGGAENAQSHGSAYGMRAALRVAAAVQGGETR